jgi:hypothetical protein
VIRLDRRLPTFEFGLKNRQQNITRFYCSILGHAISKPDSLRCFVFCGAASKTCGFSFLALAFKWQANCHKYGGTQQAVGEAWLIRPQLKLPHALYCLIVWNLA